MQQIIGIDLASEKLGDWTVICSVCSNCKNIIEMKKFKPNKNAPQMSVFIRCPNCGIKFDRHVIREEF